MKQPVLLCYNLSDEAARKIRLAAMRLKVRMRIVKPWEQLLPVESLCMQPTSESGETPDNAFADEMLVMAYFPNGAIQALLQLMRRSGVPSIGLKAMLTATNAVWDSITLHDEIAKEHEAMQSGAEKAHSSK